MRTGLFLLCALPCIVCAYEFEGEIGGEMRTFVHEGLESQARNHPSAYLQPKIIHDWNEDKENFTCEVFYRVDRRDSKRTHGDIRECSWTHAEDKWEILLGISKVFWGVIESRHLVDVINQTDLVENIDEEDKLGQPMVKATWVTRRGTFTGFFLPVFRERTFPGSKGRLRSQPKVAPELTIYEVNKQKKQGDWAARWSHTIKIWDLGVSIFRGTAREPHFFPAVFNSEPVLAPYYERMTQEGFDAQATVKDWLWKFEGILRQTTLKDHAAFSAGFEYTKVGIFDSDKDLGFLLEYHYDSRKDFSPQPFNEDIAFGVRLSFNDVQSTELLAFILFDHHLRSRVFRIEASRRFAENFTLGLESSLFDNINARDPLYALRQDDFVQLNIAYHF